ncbi:MAG: type III-B CRISPR module-associated Cmr3 family protein [Gammaproteobacteria bacterium]
MNGHSRLLNIEPLDTVFFRDGRPYTKDECEQVGVASQFPPAPATLVGAVRAAVARGLGWNGRGSWGDDIKQKLGDGENLGALRFRGPLLLQHVKPLYLAPANLMRNEAGKTTLLVPGPARDCDLDKAVRLPALPSGAPGDGWKQAGLIWLSLDGLSTALKGKEPAADTIVEQKSLWSLEARVGIARDEATRTTGEGALYSPQHIRLHHGVTLGIWLEGLDEETLARIPRKPHPVGGEARSAWITVADAAPDLPASPATLQRDGKNLNYTVVVLTPLPLASAPAPGQAIPGLPGTLVSACLPRVLMLGGWDSVKKQPLPLQPHLAPGSVLFMQAGVEEEHVIRALHGTCIGLRPTWGYGWIAIGTWGNQ